MEDDLQREAYLEQLGYHVMRFTNEEVMFNTDWVIQEIENYFNK